MFHLLGEVEVVFGFWALVLVLFVFAVEGNKPATDYVDSRNFTEPLFVFAIMVIAGSQPILNLATLLVNARGAPDAPADLAGGLLSRAVDDPAAGFAS